MASKVTEDAIEAFLRTNWDKAPILTANVEGEAPADGSPFLELQFPVADDTRQTLGTRASGLYREEGGFRILINMQRGEGMARLRAWGDELASLFRDVQIGEVHCLVPSPLTVDDQSGEGNFYSGSFACPFERAYRG